MKKFALALIPMALMLTLALAACGKPAAGGGPNATSTGGGAAECPASQTINLSQVDFAEKCVTVSANQVVTFNDPSSTGGFHIICAGANGTCQADANAPKELAAPGFQIQPGEQKQVTFTNTGTFKLACTVHPAMNMTVVVK